MKTTVCFPSGKNFCRFGEKRKCFQINSPDTLHAKVSKECPTPDNNDPTIAGSFEGKSSSEAQQKAYQESLALAKRLKKQRSRLQNAIKEAQDSERESSKNWAEETEEAHSDEIIYRVGKKISLGEIVTAMLSSRSKTGKVSENIWNYKFALLENEKDECTFKPLAEAPKAIGIDWLVKLDPKSKTVRIITGPKLDFEGKEQRIGGEETALQSDGEVDPNVVNERLLHALGEKASFKDNVANIEKAFSAFNSRGLDISANDIDFYRDDALIVDLTTGSNAKFKEGSGYRMIIKKDSKNQLSYDLKKINDNGASPHSNIGGFHEMPTFDVIKEYREKLTIKIPESDLRSGSWEK